MIRRFFIRYFHNFQLTVPPQALFHTGHASVEVHGQHGAAEECQREDGDDGEQCAGAERLAFEVFQSEGRAMRYGMAR